MDKRVIAVICILTALASFLGGVVFQFREDKAEIKQEEVRYEALQEEYNALYNMPIDFDAVYKWVDRAAYYHQYSVDYKANLEDIPLELHQEYVTLYITIKNLFMIFEKEHLLGTDNE